MYAFIRGILARNESSYAILSTGGIGYKIAIPTHTNSKLPELGQEVLLHTSFVVREQSQALFGFLTEGEKELFEILIEISGIGPKTALSLVGHLPPQEMEAVILAEDTAILSKIPGIGKKTAERLVIELRGKLDGLPKTIPAKNQKMQDALKALMKLGYNPATAQKALKKSLDKSGEKADVGELISGALRHVK